MVTIYVEGQLAQFMNRGNFINQFYTIRDSNNEDFLKWEQRPYDSVYLKVIKRVFPSGLHVYGFGPTARIRSSEEVRGK
jgi:hypothetical protein